MADLKICDLEHGNMVKATHTIEVSFDPGQPGGREQIKLDLCDAHYGAATAAIDQFVAQ